MKSNKTILQNCLAASFLCCLHASMVFAATKEEALLFLIENLTLNKLTCDYAEGKVVDGYNFYYSFNPRAVLIRKPSPQAGDGKFFNDEMRIGCMSGRCIKQTNRNENSLQAGATLYKPETVDAERIIKAFNFFIDACGGSKKSAF